MLLELAAVIGDVALLLGDPLLPLGVGNAVAFHRLPLAQFILAMRRVLALVERAPLRVLALVDRLLFRVASLVERVLLGVASLVERALLGVAALVGRTQGVSAILGLALLLPALVGIATLVYRMLLRLAALIGDALARFGVALLLLAVLCIALLRIAALLDCLLLRLTALLDRLPLRFALMFDRLLLRLATLLASALQRLAGLGGLRLLLRAGAGFVGACLVGVLARVAFGLLLARFGCRALGMRVLLMLVLILRRGTRGCLAGERQCERERGEAEWGVLGERVPVHGQTSEGSVSAAVGDRGA